MALTLARFGWQGIEFSVPSDWELNAYRGVYPDGFASLDDGLHTRLRVRWEPEKRRAADVRAARELYIRALQKRLGRKMSLESIGPEFLPKRFRDRHDALVFSWQARQAAIGMIWRCPERRLLGLVEVLFPGGDVDRTLSRRIFSTLADHREDGRQLWAAYGFQFEIPGRFRLQHAELVPGRLRFHFQMGRDWLRVERWSAASQWMKETSLDIMPEEWLKTLRTALSVTLEKAGHTLRAHAAVRFTCETREYLLRKSHLNGLMWICAAEDRMYVAAANNASEKEVEAVARTMVCA
ncbi:MAG TPA: hypothetical protein PKO36_17300 [Candidatus Hydrogenedentes bacterium]|nr:hypothetical protein [Candidatus Hydrogenedentota bacterium]HOV73202.1 hypothetical protein [Candidatus Hydrogenedentota bacterium]